MKSENVMNGVRIFQTGHNAYVELYKKRINKKVTFVNLIKYVKQVLKPSVTSNEFYLGVHLHPISFDRIFCNLSKFERSYINLSYLWPDLFYHFLKITCSRVVKSIRLPAKITAYLVSICGILWLAFLYIWRFLNKISVDWPLTLTSQPSISNLSENPANSILVKSTFFLLKPVKWV